MYLTISSKVIFQVASKKPAGSNDYMILAQSRAVYGNNEERFDPHRAPYKKERNRKIMKKLIRLLNSDYDVESLILNLLIVFNI